MQIDYNILPEIILYTSIFFSLYYLFYRRYIYSVLDPIFIYIFTLSFSSVLVMYTLVDQPLYLYHFFLCHVFLFAGFTLMSHWCCSFKSKTQPVHLPEQFYDYYILRIVVYVLSALYIIANITLFLTTGFALLSDEPTVAKVENFDKGFGIILLINWGVGGFLIAASLFFILSKPKSIDFLILSIIVLFTALEGSKASLLRILITLVLLLNHPLFHYKKKNAKFLKYIAPVGMLGVLSIFFIVFSKETTDSDQVLFAFIRRLLYGADSTLFFYHPANEQYFARYDFWDYISHFFNPIFSFLRIAPNEEALGNLIVMNALPDATGPIVGPNTPYYIEGQIYFGYYGALIYSAVIGASYAFIRQYFFNARYFSSFWLVLICCICQQASTLNIEVTLFITQAFNTCFFVIPTYVITYFLISGKILFRKPHFI